METNKIQTKNKSIQNVWKAHHILMKPLLIENHWIIVIERREYFDGPAKFVEWQFYVCMLYAAKLCHAFQRFC